jgi:precorrin-3B methylase
MRDHCRSGPREDPELPLEADLKNPVKVQHSMVAQRTRVTIVGAGVGGVRALTLEAICALRNARRVLAFSSPSTLASIGIANVDDLSSLYREGARDMDNYARICRKIVESVSKWNDIVLLLPGHPRVGVSLVNLLEGLAKSHSFRVEIIAGLSSFDLMLTELRRDALENGSVLVDANRLLLFDYEIEPNLDYYIFHVCSIGTARTYRRQPWRENRIDELRNKLLRHYEKTHKVALVTVGKANRHLEKIEATVHTLTSIARHLSFNSTLVIPRIRRSIMNTKFLATLRMD